MGDLNGGSGLGKLDGGTNATATAPRLAMSGRRKPDLGGCGLQECWTSAAMQWAFAPAWFDEALTGKTDGVSGGSSWWMR